MKLEKVILENYRGYKQRTEIKINDLTALIGKNDVGKSSVLDALNTFFNEKEYEFSLDDFCKIEPTSKICKISCIFSGIPEKIVIDETAETNLKQEFLLNKDELLEIEKVWDASTGKVKSLVNCLANHPTHEKLKDLLLLTNSQLKQRAKEFNLSGVDLRTNNEIREAIRNSISSQQWKCEEVEIRLDDKELKNLWEKLQKYMPLYALFKSDRPSTDADQEAQDPMMVAVEQALKAVQDDLDRIVCGISEKLKDVTQRTLDEVKKFSPELAQELIPVLPTKDKIKWKNLFKPSIQCENNIPINKKGSGTRRLILMSFFRAELIKKREKHDKTDVDDVIFAIEEPETSQHPDNILMIINVLKELASSQDTQVILTTHVPAIAKELDIDDIRFIKKEIAGPQVLSVSNNGYEILKDVSESLDMSAFYSTIQKVKVLVYFEGPNDILLMKQFSSKLHEKDNKYVDLNDEAIALIPLGGSTLFQWINEDYLKKLDIPQFFIFDGDKEEYKQKALEIQEQHDPKKIAMTSEPYMTFENIISSRAIIEEITARYNNITNFSNLSLSENKDISFSIAKFIYEYSHSENFDTLDEEKKKEKRSFVKKWLNNSACAKMSAEEILASDPHGILQEVLKTVKSFL